MPTIAQLSDAGRLDELEHQLTTLSNLLTLRNAAWLPTPINPSTADLSSFVNVSRGTFGDLTAGESYFNTLSVSGPSSFTGGLSITAGADTLGAEQIQHGDFGQIYGPYLPVANGTFTGSADGWEIEDGSCWVYGDNVIDCVGELDGDFSQTIGVLGGHQYNVAFDVLGYEQGEVHAGFYEDDFEARGNGAFEGNLDVYENNEPLTFWAADGFIGSVDNISVRERFWDVNEGWTIVGNRAVHTPGNYGIADWDGVDSGDAGYEVGDILTAVGGDNNATFIVTEIDDGYIEDMELLTTGSGYTSGNDYDLSGGTGSGAVIYDVSLDGEDNLRQPGMLDAGYYRVTLTVGGTTGHIEVCLDGGECQDVAAGVGTIAFTGFYEEDDFNKLVISPTVDFDGFVSDVSVKPIEQFGVSQTWTNTLGGNIMRLTTGGLELPGLLAADDVEAKNLMLLDDLMVGDERFILSVADGDDERFAWLDGPVVIGGGNGWDYYWQWPDLDDVTDLGFADSDAAMFVPVYTGDQTSDLRLYILDDEDDSFSIWGNSCQGNCGDLNSASVVAHFRADGNVGIGTAEPLSRLHVEGGFATLASGANIYGVGNPGRSVKIGSSGGQPWIKFLGGDGNDSRITTDQNNLRIYPATGVIGIGQAVNGEIVDSPPMIIGSMSFQGDGGVGWGMGSKSNLQLRFENVAVDVNTDIFVFDHMASGGRRLFDVREQGTSVFTIMPSGNVGIGTTAPDALLDVNGNVGMRGGVFNSYDPGTPTNLLHRFTHGGNGVGTLQLYSGGSVLASITAGNITSCSGIQTNASGAMSCASDENLKNLHGDFTAGLSAISLIEPKAFAWKEGSDFFDGGIVYHGFIAQNVERALPEAVNTGSHGYKQVSTTVILAAAVNAIKELNLKVDELLNEPLAAEFAGVGEPVGLSAILDSVRGLLSSGTLALISAVEGVFGQITAHHADVETLDVQNGAVFRSGFTILDSQTGEPLCVTAEDGFLKVTPGECAIETPEPSSEPTSSATPEPSATPTPALSPTPEHTPEPTPSPEPTESPSPIPTPSPNESPSPTPTPSPTPEATPTPSPTPEPEPEPTPTPDLELENE